MRTDLELFLLALVQQGLATPYDLKMKAGVSLGSTVPALQRLEDAKLIQAPAKAGARRSRPFSLTEAGKKELRQSWKELMKGRPTDLDSILRTAYLAWLNGHTETSAQFMQHSADGLKGWASSLRAEADRLAATYGPIPDGDAFKWLKTYCEAARAEADAAALVELSVRIRKTRTTKKQKRSSTKS